jgi:hypothetical protein
MEFVEKMGKGEVNFQTHLLKYNTVIPELTPHVTNVNGET